jgi:hypothetical protein
MSHDQLFKDLLQAFFREFMELFFSNVATRLDFAQVTFSTTEVFTDIPEGEQRNADLIARVMTLDGKPELILVHLEVQAVRRNVFPFRMCEYYWLLRLRHRLRVFPIALFLAPGAGGLVRETYVESLFDEEVLRFQYHAVGLPDLSADDYRESANPLAPALSALMRPGSLGKLALKVESLRRVLVSNVDEARKSLLLNVVERYMPLSIAEEVEFVSLIGQEEAQEVRNMLTIYEERGIVTGKRDLTLHLLRRKFGELPEPVITKLQAIQSGDELERIFDRSVDAVSLQDTGLIDEPETR